MDGWEDVWMDVEDGKMPMAQHAVGETQSHILEEWVEPLNLWRKRKDDQKDRLNPQHCSEEMAFTLGLQSAKPQ